MPSAFAAASLPCPARTLKSLSTMIGLTKANSRRLDRSYVICSGECVRALFTYGISLLMSTSCISVVVVIFCLSFRFFSSSSCECLCCGYAACFCSCRSSLPAYPTLHHRQPICNNLLSYNSPSLVPVVFYDTVSLSVSASEQRFHHVILWI